MADRSAIKIFVGLGNPGKEYENTYHNVGFLMLEEIFKDQFPIEERSASNLLGVFKSTQSTLLLSPKAKYKNLFEYQEINSKRLGSIIFLWPLTYMNESGKAVREALKKFKAEPKNLIVVHDDSDIATGDYKISFARNSAGHKGVQSIIDNIKTNAFHRIRIGIRPANETKRQKAGEFALKQITLRDKKILATVFSAIHSRIFSAPAGMGLIFSHPTRNM